MTLIGDYLSSDFHNTFSVGPLPIDVDGEFLGRTFAHLPLEEQTAIICANKWAILGRRVAGYLSYLSLSDNTKQRSFDDCGTYINLVGHALTAAILNKSNVKDATGYIASVNKAMTSVFRSIENNKALSLKEQNVWQELNTIDVPNDQWSKDVKIESGSTQTVADMFVELFTEAFATTIITRDKSTSGKSLRALPVPERKEQILALVKKCVVESGIIKDFERLQLLEDSSCILLEGKEIHTWVHNTAKKMEFTPEQFQGLAIKTPEALKKAAIDTVFADVVKRMEAFAKQHPKLSLQPQELKAFIIQDFYPRLMAVKHTIESTIIENARQHVCPEIKPVQYPRVTHFAIPLPPMKPLSFQQGDGQVTLLSYLEQAQNVLHNDGLGVIICQLKRDDADRASTLALKHFASTNPTSSASG